MHRIGRQIHAGVVVKIARLDKRRDELVNAGDAGFAGGDIRRQLGIIFGGVEPGLVGFDIGPDALRMRQIDPLPVIAPGQLLNEFLRLFRITYGCQRRVAHLVEAQNAVADIG